MIDTNVWISLFVFKGKRFEELIIKVCLQHTLVMNSVILDELSEVVDKKFNNKTDSLNNFLEKIPYEFVTTSEDVQELMDFQIRDKNDEKILVSAMEANVDVFITGDKDFLDAKINKPIILTPTEFLEKY